MTGVAALMRISASGCDSTQVPKQGHLLPAFAHPAQGPGEH
jgi:hypothetical protein